ncbi:MAG: RNase adapter RapZ [Actinomycetota bacterium]
MTAEPAGSQERRGKAADRRRGPRDRRRTKPAKGPEFIVITGLSGAGRSEAAKSLEDLDYFVIDNMPPALVGRVAELAATSGGPRRVGIVVDARGGKFFDDLHKGLDELREGQVPYRIVFLEASDETLVRRFSTTRRRHPLAPDGRVDEGIRKERLVMDSLRAQADLVIDTTEFTPHDLRDRIRETFASAEPRGDIQVTVLSFSYKHGVPRDADLVLDVRFLPNPHWVEELRALRGTDKRVRNYVLRQQSFGEFKRRLVRLLDFVIPGYISEGKSFLTVAVGCTGGRHRSVVVAEELAEYFRNRRLPVVLEHRDVDRE